MNDNAKKWVAELRSGEYKQGRQFLRFKPEKGPDEFCCLGVACDLAMKDGIELDVSHSLGVVAYNNQQAFLPDAVRQWLGLLSNRGSFNRGGFEVQDIQDLAGLNDRGHTFKQIADTIESEPAGLFK